MDYTSKDNAQHMMDAPAHEEAYFEASFDSTENRFQSAERSFKTWDLRKSESTVSLQHKAWCISDYF